MPETKCEQCELKDSIIKELANALDDLTIEAYDLIHQVLPTIAKGRNLVDSAKVGNIAWPGLHPAEVVK